MEYSLEEIKAARAKCYPVSGAETDWLIAEVERLTAEADTLRTEVEALSRTDSPDVRYITVRGFDQLTASISQFTSERDRYKAALERIAEHLKLPCDKRDDGVLEQIVAGGTGMTVNQVMAALRQLQKEGHGKQQCEIFPHDNDPDNLDSGDGTVGSVRFVERSNGETFVAICA